MQRLSMSASRGIRVTTNLSYDSDICFLRSQSGSIADHGLPSDTRQYSEAGKEDIPIFKKGYHVVHVFERHAANGDDNWFSRLRNPFDKHPVIATGTGDLNNRHIEIFNKVNGFFVKGSRHWDTVRLLDRFHEPSVFLQRQPGVQHPLHVINIVPVPKIFMNEGINIAKLEFNGSPNVVKSRNAGKLMYYFEPSIYISFVVVCHLQDKEIFKNVSIHYLPPKTIEY
jgi:hypothetical protein